MFHVEHRGQIENGNTLLCVREHCPAELIEGVWCCSACRIAQLVNGAAFARVPVVKLSTATYAKEKDGTLMIITTSAPVDFPKPLVGEGWEMIHIPWYTRLWRWARNLGREVVE